MLRQVFIAFAIGIVWFLSQVGYARTFAEMQRRYVGELVFHQGHEDGVPIHQIAKLDIVMRETADGLQEDVAILTLHFGGFQSGEYLAYYFDRISHGARTGSKTFISSAQPVSIIIKESTAQKISAIFFAEWGEGKLELKRDGVASFTPHTIGSLHGSYEGLCDDVSHSMEIAAYRSTTEMGRVNYAYSPYSIKAKLSDGISQNTPSSERRVERIYTEGTFLFSDHLLILSGPRSSMECQIRQDEWDLSCVTKPAKSVCHFQKTEKTSQHRLTPSLADPAFGDFSVPSSQYAVSASEYKGGYYLGYLHHENLDVFQLASLSLIKTEEIEDQFLLGIAKLYFHGHERQENISYRFDKVSLPDSEEIIAPKTFKNDYHEVDAVVQVLAFDENYVQGVWFSRLFGRVGTFKLCRTHSGSIAPVSSGCLDLPEGAKKMISMSGTYHGSTGDFHVSVGRGAEPMHHIVNPFFPNTMFANFLLRDSLGLMEHSTNSTYDIYTDRIAFEFQGDRVGFRLLIGSREGSHLRLQHYNAVPFSAFVPMKVDTFIKQNSFEAN